MEKDEKSEYARLLSTIEDIRVQAGGELDIPQICVLGDQGSGKSSWLSSIVPGLRGVLPTGRGTVTRCPTAVRVRPGDSEKVVIGNEKREFLSGTPKGKREAKNALLELQKELMNEERQKHQGGGNDGNEEQAPVCDTEVVVEYVGPQVVDLVLVDLPGLIQSGPGVGKVEAMARRYIESESTLIVIVREADLDQERAAAVKLAAEADPRQERTLQVLTKCDSFSKVEGEVEVMRLVRSQPEDCASDTSLAVHLTCCDPEGVSEEEYFKVHNFNNYSNVGSRDLAARRLPHLLAQRISGCKPALLQQIRSKQEQARAVLREIGRSPATLPALSLRDTLSK